MEHVRNWTLAVALVNMACTNTTEARSIHWLPPEVLVESSSTKSHSTGTDYGDETPMGRAVNQKGSPGTQIAATSQGIALTWIRTDYSALPMGVSSP